MVWEHCSIKLSRQENSTHLGFVALRLSSIFTVKAPICFSAAVVGHSGAATPGLGRLSVLMTV